MTSPGSRVFDHERLEVYRKARAASEAAEAVALHLPPRHLGLADQLRRAANSVVLNIAEGAGEFRPAEKARFYRVALRSATETVAALDLATSRTRVPVDEAGTARALLLEVVAMLTRLVKNLQS